MTGAPRPERPISCLEVILGSFKRVRITQTNESEFFTPCGDSRGGKSGLRQCGADHQGNQFTLVLRLGLGVEARQVSADGVNAQFELIGDLLRGLVL